MKTRKKICLFLVPIIIITDIFNLLAFSDLSKFSFVLMLLYSAYKSRDSLLFIAFVFSTIADFILIFTVKNQLGILFFSISFCVYIIRHNGNKAIIPIIYLAVFVLNKTSMPSIFIAYACLFYVNLYYVFKNCRKLFKAFFLFAICDVITAVRFCYGYMPSYVIWLFYAPSIYQIVFTPATM